MSAGWAIAPKITRSGRGQATLVRRFVLWCAFGDTGGAEPIRPVPGKRSRRCANLSACSWAQPTPPRRQHSRSHELSPALLLVVNGMRIPTGLPSGSRADARRPVGVAASSSEDLMGCSTKRQGVNRTLACGEGALSSLGTAGFVQVGGGLAVAKICRANGLGRSGGLPVRRPARQRRASCGLTGPGAPAWRPARGEHGGQGHAGRVAASHLQTAGPSSGLVDHAIRRRQIELQMGRDIAC